MIDADSDQNTCIVCLEQPANAVLLECGHAGICGTCASLLWEGGRRCPLCRELFAGVMLVVEETGGQARS